MSRNARILVLFDVDGTLTEPRECAAAEMKSFLVALKEKVVMGIVGGSDLVKQQEQMGANITNEADYSFSENGLVAFKDGKEIGRQAIHKHLGEENIKRVVNFALRYIANLDLPVKRGTFIEFRAGMLNVSPIGRNCSKEERNDYEKFDLAHNIRKDMIALMRTEFADLNLTYSIGGQISFDVFPQGWDKTYCLNLIGEDEYDEIHFFGACACAICMLSCLPAPFLTLTPPNPVGDKTFEGGNDYEIFTHPRVKGHTTTSPADTMRQCRELFGV